MIVSVDTEKAFGKNPPIFHDEYIHQARNRRKFPQPGKGHLWKAQS